MDKKELYLLIMKQLDERLDALATIQEELRDALTQESKSSAGDKHETGRAMTHLEQEKLTQQQLVVTQMKARLSSLDPKLTHMKVGFGSVVETNQGWYFLSVALGEIVFGSIPVFVLSSAAPLAQVLMDKKTGEKVIFQGKQISIRNVF
jgi:transcription elongation GreA/GreB family factor